MDISTHAFQFLSGVVSWQALTFLLPVAVMVWRFGTARLCKDEKCLLAMLYAASYPVIVFVKGFDTKPHLAVDGVCIFNWGSGVEPEPHKAHRTHWLSVAERLIDRGLLVQTGDGVFALSGRGLRVAKCYALYRRDLVKERNDVLRACNQVKDSKRS